LDFKTVYFRICILKWIVGLDLKILNPFISYSYIDQLPAIEGKRRSP